MFTVNSLTTNDFERAISVNMTQVEAEKVIEKVCRDHHVMTQRKANKFLAQVLKEKRLKDMPPSPPIPPAPNLPPILPPLSLPPSQSISNCNADTSS